MNLDGHRPGVVLAMSELFTLLDPEDEYRHLEFARAAEDAGVTGLFVSEHVVMGPSANALGTLPNPRGFVRPGMQDPATPWPAPLIKLAAMAGATSRIRVISAAFIAPLRHPIIAAKEIATLDLISRGRFTVLPSVSWHEDEYRALQIEFGSRGARLDEHLAIWRALWTQTPAAFHGEHYSFTDVYFSPKPDLSRLRIWLGGTSLRPGLIRRIVEYGDGFFPGFPLTAEDRSTLREALAAAGRDVADLEIMGWVVPQLPPDGVADIDATLDEMVPLRVEQGCDLIAIKPSSYIDSPDEMHDFCTRVVSRVDSMF